LLEFSQDAESPLFAVTPAEAGVENGLKELDF